MQVVGIECRVEDLLALQRERIVEARNRNEVVQLYSPNPVRLGLPKPAGDDESPEEQERVAKEFHPAGDVGGGFVDVEVEDTEDESVEYDLETGEVIERPAPESAPPPEDPADKPSDKSTQPAIPAAGDKPEPPTVAMMEKISAQLRDLAIARGFDPMNEAEFKGAVKEVFKQIVTDYVGEEPLTFKGLVRKQAELVITGLSRELAAVADRDATDDGGVP